jgi:hypothetical protein
MALEESDFAKLGSFISSEIGKVKTELEGKITAAAPAPATTPGAGTPAPASGLEYWVHLADGEVKKLAESEISSHIDGVAVIAKYLVGA